MKTITVIGAGNCSYAASAELAIKGHRVRMLVDPEHWEEIVPVAANKTIVLYENKMVREAKLELVTDSPEKALAGSEIILVPIPAYGQDPMLEWVADYLMDEQLVLFAPGNFGGLSLRRILKERGIYRNIRIAETNETPFNAAKLGGNRVELTGRISGLMLSALPTSATKEVLMSVGELFPVERAKHILHCALHATNPCYHVPGCVLNAGRIQRAKGDFYLYEEGITPAVAAVMEVLDQERVSILKALDCPYYTVVQEMADGREPRTMWEEINGCQGFEFVKGPESLESRYLTEDVPYLLQAWLMIGKCCGLHLPVMESLTILGGILIGEARMKKGRTLGNMGLQNFNKNALELLL